MAIKCKHGLMACELAPDCIGKQSLPKIITHMSALIKAKIVLPSPVWIHLVMKTCWSYVEGERFDKLAQALRPWSLAGGPMDGIGLAMGVPS